MLVDVHAALDLAAPDAVGDTERVFVRGSYEYHHYGQVRGSPRRAPALFFLDTAGRVRPRRASTTTAGDVPTAAARQFFRGVCSLPVRARVCAGRISPDSVNL